MNIYMQLIALLVLTNIIFIFGCNNIPYSGQIQTNRGILKTHDTTKSVPKTLTSFAPTRGIEGEWFIVATNPAFAGKIITDYISFNFSADGLVTKTIRSDGKIKTEKGIYKWNQEKKGIDATFYLEEAGVQVSTWRQDTLGKATIVFWKNLTYGHERSENEVYIKKGTSEWNCRDKKALSPQTPHPSVDPYQLIVGVSYRLSKETPLMPKFEPADPMRAIQKIKRIPAGHIVTVLSQKRKNESPWYLVKYKTYEGWINSVALLGQSLELVE